METKPLPLPLWTIRELQDRAPNVASTLIKEYKVDRGSNEPVSLDLICMAGGWHEYLGAVSTFRREESTPRRDELVTHLASKVAGALATATAGVAGGMLVATFAGPVLGGIAAVTSLVGVTALIDHFSSPPKT